MKLEDSSAQGAMSYKYAAGAESRLFFFATGEGAWCSGEWASNAAVLCVCGPEMMLAGGSYVEHGGKTVRSGGERPALLECREDGGE